MTECGSPWTYQPCSTPRGVIGFSTGPYRFANLADNRVLNASRRHRLLHKTASGAFPGPSLSAQRLAASSASPRHPLALAKGFRIRAQRLAASSASPPSSRRSCRAPSRVLNASRRHRLLHPSALPLARTIRRRAQRLAASSASPRLDRGRAGDPPRCSTPRGVIGFSTRALSLGVVAQDVLNASRRHRLLHRSRPGLLAHNHFRPLISRL